MIPRLREHCVLASLGMTPLSFRASAASRGIASVLFVAALLALGALAVTSCGLKPSAVDSLKQQQQQPGVTTGGTTGASTGAGATSTGGFTTPPGGGTTTGSATGSTGFTGSTGGTTTGTSGASTGGTTGTTTGGTTGATSGGTTGSAGGSRVGISSTVIRLGLHAPQTGAAPVPLRAFQTGTKLFWEDHKIFGHKVVVDFLDDQYKPSVARQVCEELARKDFLVIGGAGTDQIQACASDPVLGRSHTPYLSEGVTTNGLTTIPNYFAISQTYAAQTPEVYTNARNVYPTEAAGNWAIVTTQSPNFDDVTTAMASVLRSHHVTYKVFRTPKDGSAQDASNLVNALRSFGAKTVFLTISPNFWLDILGAAGATYRPAWVGPGVTMGENLVANIACNEQPGIKATFLSPFFALDREPSGFKNERNPSPDALPAERDLELDIYAASEVVYRALLSVGSIKNLTRENFIANMAHFSASYGHDLTVYPTVRYNGGHFGGTGAWSEKLNCARQQYVTVGSHYLTS